MMTLGGPGRGGWVGGPALSPLPSLTSCWSSPSPPPAGFSLPPPHCRCPDRQSTVGSRLSEPLLQGTSKGIYQELRAAKGHPPTLP